LPEDQRVVDDVADGGGVGRWRKTVADVSGCHCAVLEGVKLDREAGKSRLRNRGRGLDVSVCLACERFDGMMWNGSSKLRERGLEGRTEVQEHLNTSRHQWHEMSIQ
jgi:hypothetical protein